MSLSQFFQRKMGREGGFVSYNTEFFLSSRYGSCQLGLEISLVGSFNWNMADVEFARQAVVCIFFALCSQLVERAMKHLLKILYWHPDIPERAVMSPGRDMLMLWTFGVVLG